MTPKPPSARQLNYLRALANRTGQTFTYPTTGRDASKQIQRLKAQRPSCRVEFAMERADIDAEHAAREANCDVQLSPHETEGYGSTATWSRRP